MLISRKTRIQLLSLFLLSMFSVFGYSQEAKDGDKKVMSKYEKALKKSEEEDRKKNQKVAGKNQDSLNKSKKESEKQSDKAASDYEDALKRPLEEYVKQDKKAKKIEQKADSRFIKQEFDKAMTMYEEAVSKPLVNEYSGVLHLKIARLYLNLLNYPAAIPHFEKAIEIDESLFSSVDVCNYLDALRYTGEKMRAIVIARKYAYDDAYRRDQRYLNILHALNYEDGFLPVGTAEFNITRLNNMNTPYSEFWIGKINNEYFYATSNSQFHDPSKKFYHRTKYYSLSDDSEFSLKAMSVPGNKKSRQILHMVPIDLQNGPLSISDNMEKMVVTAFSYENGENIKMTEGGMESFLTKLYYSEYNPKRNSWSAFKYAFPQQKGSSYAHPFLFNNSRSILFSSNVPGGYGGYDLYVAHWNDKIQQWGEPINLGSLVNTEGDEISPTINEDLLIFASNGQVGFGGYDLYSIIYENGSLVNGSLSHFGYPINTVHNDFSMYLINKDKGYIVSDRYPAYKDDVYYFERNRGSKPDNLIFGMTEAKAISNGLVSLVENEGDFNSPRHETLPKFNVPPQNMLSLYFDFDKANITPDTEQSLYDWFFDTDFSQIKSLTIDGFADELGSRDHNYRLSENRARNIADWLKQQGVDIPVHVYGRGQISLGDDELEMDKKTLSPSYSISEVQPASYTYSPLLQKIWMNRKARRVEIKATMK